MCVFYNNRFLFAAHLNEYFQGSSEAMWRLLYYQLDILERQIFISFQNMD